MSLGKIIELPRITDPRGNLTVAEANKNIPLTSKEFIGCMMFLAENAEVDTHISK